MKDIKSARKSTQVCNRLGYRVGPNNCPSPTTPHSNHNYAVSQEVTQRSIDVAVHQDVGHEYLEKLRSSIGQEEES